MISTENAGTPRRMTTPGHIAPIAQVDGTNELMTQIHDARLRLHGTGQGRLMTRRTRERDSLAPPLAPPACSVFSNYDFDLEPPYGIEP